MIKNKIEAMKIAWRLFAVIVIAFVGATNVAHAQRSACCNCPNPNVGVFDFIQNISPPGMQTPENRSNLDYRNWNDARQGFLEGYQPEVKNDPVCSVYFTSITLGEQYKEIVTGGFDPGNAAVRGDFDYVLSGLVTFDQGNYLLKVKLADGTTAEKVWETTEMFASDSEAKEAGRHVAARMLPLFGKICDFWSKKREENTENAVHPQIQVKPSKEKINVDESTVIEITALDCDNSPLKNRKVNLSSDNGTFSPQTVTTDGSGKAAAQFKATKPGLGTLSARLEYISIVKHKPAKADGYKAIQIGDPPSGVWRVVLDISEEDSITTDLQKSDDSSVSKSHGTQVVHRGANLTFFIKGKYDAYLHKFNGNEILAFGGGGEYTLAEFNAKSEKSSLSSRFAWYKYKGQGSLDRANFHVFSFEVAPDRAWVNGTVPLVGSVQNDSYSVEVGAIPCCVSQHQTQEIESHSIEFGSGSDTVEIKLMPQSAKDGVYKFILDKIGTENNPDSGTTETRKRTGTITLEQLKRSQTPSGIKPSH